jgi:1-acyl-sn-glycerol-3-phosphate acyltransferase
LSDPEAFAAIRGRSVLYLANHQVAVESLLFSIIASGLSGVPTVTLAKAEHRTTWLGLPIKHCFAYPGIVDPRVITYFDREDPASLMTIIKELADEMMGPGKSVMVHVEGTRSLSCREPLVKMSSAFVDLALATRAPVVPVRFVGGLPAEPLSERIEFPVGMGKQDICFGKPIHPETFEALPFKQRKHLVIDAVNALGPANSEEQALSPDRAFADAVAARAHASGASAEHACLHEVLRELSEPCPAVAAMLEAAAEGRLSEAAGPEGEWLTELARRLTPRPSHAGRN